MTEAKQTEAKQTEAPKAEAKQTEAPKPIFDRDTAREFARRIHGDDNPATKQTEAPKRFRDLRIGQRFDWVNDANPTWNSFYLRCTKITPRKYMDERGTEHKVGSINAIVHHVEEL